jgi:predicted nucleic acid-binding protein
VSSVTVFEVFYGCSPENLAMMTLLFEGFTILSFDAKVAKIASREYQKLRERNQYVTVRELVIAATALARNLPLATLNTQPFELFPDIKIVF